MISIEFDGDSIIEGLREFGETLDREMSDAMGTSLQLIANTARQTTAFTDRTEQLRNSIEAQQPPYGAFLQGTLEGVVSAGAPHALVLEEGSGRHGPKAAPYRIRAKHRKALRIPIEGGYVFRREVWHPGVEARAYLAKALEQELPEIDRIFGDHAELALVRSGFA